MFHKTKKGSNFTFMNKQPILCYLDFTELTDNLQQWVNHINNAFQAPVDLLFVRDHNTDLVMGKSIKDASILKAMNDFRKSSGATEGENFIREGCNCSLISQLAEERDALFMLIPVHKRRDVQFLGCTTLLKMLRRSRIPALVIPENNQFNKPGSISVAINYRKAQKSVTPWAAHLSKKMELTIKMIVPLSDEDGVHHNASFAKKFWSNHGLTVDIEKDTVKAFAADKYALKNTDIHCLHLSRQPGFFERLLGDQDSYLLANKAGTPVFCINPGDKLYIPCT